MSDDQIKSLRERDPVAWFAYFPGCGSVNSQTFTSHRKYDAQAWEKQGAEVTPLYADPPHFTELEAENARLKSRLAEALEALHLFEQYGCPVCHGDCASANPPVNSCPMQAARRVREGGRDA